MEPAQDAAHLVDRDASTSCSFAGQSPFFVLEAPSYPFVPALTRSTLFLHDYSVVRAGPSAVSQWTLYACAVDTYPCTDWAAISQSSLSATWPGAVPVHVTSDLNRPSRFFRMALQAAASGADPIAVHEIAVSLSGLAVEAAMYPESVVTVGETVAIQPQPFEGDAVFAISPALPASLTLDAATGAIEGAGAGHFAANWNVYTVTRSLGGETKRFTLILVDGRGERRGE